MMGMPPGQMGISEHGSDHDHEAAHAKENKSGY